MRLCLLKLCLLELIGLSALLSSCTVHVYKHPVPVYVERRPPIVVRNYTPRVQHRWVRHNRRAVPPRGRPRQRIAARPAPRRRRVR